MQELIIHILGFVVLSLGLSMEGVFINKMGYWVVMAAVSVIYLNALHG